MVHRKAKFVTTSGGTILGFPIAAAAQILDSPLATFSPARALCPTTTTADFDQHGPTARTFDLKDPWGARGGAEEY